MLGGNSSISKALPRTSDRETLISSRHSQILGTASKVHSRACQGKSTPQRRPQPVWRSLFHRSLQKSPKSSSGSGRDPSSAAQPKQPGSRQQAPDRENQTEGEGKKLDKMSAGWANNPICRRWVLREEMLVLLDPGLF